MTKAAGVVGGMTLLSRILGYVRDAVVASLFGAGFASDAFFVAFRIPNLLRRLFAEGSLSIAFVPVFTEYLEGQGRLEAFAMARSAWRLVSLIMTGVALAGMVSSPWIVRLIAPGFGDTPAKMMLTIAMTRLMFPYVFFISLTALCMGILNPCGVFAAPALAPVMLNLAIIAAAFWTGTLFQHPVMSLALGVLIGGMAQLALQLPFLFKLGFRFKGRGPFLHPGVRKTLRLMLPTLVGTAVYQINVLVGTLLATLLPEGSVSCLYYAERLLQFPLGIFALALATAVLPSFSRQVAGGRIDEAKQSFVYALGLVLFITIPAMVGLMVLRRPIVALLFEHGAFTPETTGLTAHALLYYSTGLWAFAAVRIVLSAFYAFGEIRLPVVAALVAMVVNLFVGILLLTPLQQGGPALAAAVASMVNLGILLWGLQKKIGTLGLHRLRGPLLKTIGGAFFMGACIWASAQMLVASNANGWAHAAGLSGIIVMGVLIYLGSAYLLKSRELEALWSVFGTKQI